jgi:hypothetical protein
LELIQVIPVVRDSDLPSNALPGGVLRGAHELLAFTREIPLDSLVQTRQLGDVPVPTFQYVFHVSSPDAIVAWIQHRIDARLEAYERAFTDEPLADSAALASFEHAVLRASDLPTPKGARLVWEWFGERLRTT